MRQIESHRITDLVEQLCIEACCVITEDIESSFKSYLQVERSPGQASALYHAGECNGGQNRAGSPLPRYRNDSGVRNHGARCTSNGRIH